MVPLNDNTLQLELLKKLELPVLIVARPGLGTINHTLLSVQCLEREKIKILGIIFCNGANKENKKAIEGFCKYKVLCSIPGFKTNKDMIDYFLSETL
jgi:dethiobiotin synthetase